MVPDILHCFPFGKHLYTVAFCWRQCTRLTWMTTSTPRTYWLFSVLTVSFCLFKWFRCLMVKHLGVPVCHLFVLGYAAGLFKCKVFCVQLFVSSGCLAHMPICLRIRWLSTYPWSHFGGENGRLPVSISASLSLHNVIGCKKGTFPFDPIYCKHGMFCLQCWTLQHSQIVHLY